MVSRIFLVSNLFLSYFLCAMHGSNPSNQGFVRYLLTKNNDGRKVEDLLRIQEPDIVSVFKKNDITYETYQAQLANGDELETSIDKYKCMLCTRRIKLQNGSCVPLYVDDSYFALLKKKYEESSR
jgi:hypothetical protein